VDVNERIVETWLREELGMFTINELYYGNHHKDIDLLAVNLNTKEIWDCEVKVRTSTTQISDNANKQNGFKHFVSSLKSKERDKKIKQYCGNNKFKVTKVFITTKSLFGRTEINQKKWLKKFNDIDIEVVFFDRIIKELQAKANVATKSNNEVIQVLKLLKIYEKK